MDGAPRRARQAAAALALVAAAAACAGPGEGDAADVVTRFYAAVAAGDGDAACALLLPGAAQDLAHESGVPCGEALVDPQEAGGVLAERAGAAVDAVHLAGGQAQVVTATDTVFLARSGGTWVVTAVGCDPRGERPYDCEVES
ncbi:hypothetical protein [Isoptericola cucumis]|uniref:Lipoprotein n=1 Tax=Isoptericola cucumis TaxID=1776856 RepID=A0ABQ2B7X3_9MICO|nr:hypothetical protein [Isoptericola cucumis]GGI07633.1 hypothetical protein GCM10007368_17140 [Isoptericola cucumis]